MGVHAGDEASACSAAANSFSQRRESSLVYS
jgi:hypothetical protein